MVQLARKKGFALIAVTDHDTMGGVAEALEAGKKYNVDVVPGVEISSGVTLEVHMLGYGMSPDHPVMKAMMEDMRAARVERMERIIENLQKMGVPITVEEVEAVAGGAIGRPHIAQVLIAHGLVPDVRTAFREYIGVGAKAYVERRKMTSEQVLANIRDAGGVPVLAAAHQRGGAEPVYRQHGHEGHDGIGMLPQRAHAADGASAARGGGAQRAARHRRQRFPRCIPPGCGDGHGAVPLERPPGLPRQVFAGRGSNTARFAYAGIGML